jgi:hypothetical protein
MSSSVRAFDRGAKRIEFRDEARYRRESMALAGLGALVIDGYRDAYGDFERLADDAIAWAHSDRRRPLRLPLGCPYLSHPAFHAGVFSGLRGDMRRATVLLEEHRSQIPANGSDRRMGEYLEADRVLTDRLLAAAKDGSGFQRVVEGAIVDTRHALRIPEWTRRFPWEASSRPDG